MQRGFSERGGGDGTTDGHEGGGGGGQPASGQLPEQGCFLSARTVCLDSCEEGLKTVGPVPSHVYPCSSKECRCSQTSLRFFF